MQTGRALIDLERVLAVERPDWVVVYGDTNSTLAAALAAAKLHQPVAHVEAGLRSFNRRMPEELNRIVADHLSELLFTPTETATANLLREGVGQSKIHQVGDVMYDASKIFGHEASLRSRYPACLGLAAKEFVLATVHRAENTEDPVRLAAIFSALHQVSRDIPVVIPLHPRTRNALRNLESAQEPATQLIIIEPVGYLDMTQLERTAAVIATDSGGVQKEACFHGTPCVTLRTETEWVELVEAGCNKLCLSLDPGLIAETILASRGSTWPTLQGYGDGTAASKIVEVLVNSRDR